MVVHLGNHLKLLQISYFFPFFPGEMLQILHSLWVVPWVLGFCQAFFEAIEVNAVDAWTLFDSLDADGDRLVSYEEAAVEPWGNPMDSQV